MAFQRRKRLTELEKRTLRLLLSGLSNKEIAADMGTEEQCVKNRLRSGFRKLGLKNSRQVIPRAGEIRAMIE
ncbi:MAG TPA: helix-turn-helix transcriptional regulator [Candidatus Angelobacter sp.]|nr:helix-turn-helix transcriptional regulator [Candidatus Angelobacter sp.]